MMVHFPQFSDNFSRESTGEDTMFGKTQCGIGTGKSSKSLWKSLGHSRKSWEVFSYGQVIFRNPHTPRTKI